MLISVYLSPIKYASFKLPSCAYCIGCVTGTCCSIISLSSPLCVDLSLSIPNEVCFIQTVVWIPFLCQGHWVHYLHMLRYHLFVLTSVYLSQVKYASVKEPLDTHMPGFNVNISTIFVLWFPFPITLSISIWNGILH